MEKHTATQLIESVNDLNNSLSDLVQVLGTLEASEEKTALLYKVTYMMSNTYDVVKPVYSQYPDMDDFE